MKKNRIFFLIAVLSFLLIRLPGKTVFAEDTLKTGINNIHISCSGNSSNTITTDDGTVWINDEIQFDKNTNKVKNDFKKIKAPIASKFAVNWDDNHFLELIKDGIVSEHGGDYYAELGDATSLDRVSPIKVYKLSGVLSIAGWREYIVAVRASDGSVWTWGTSLLGQFTSEKRNSPIRVPGLTGIKSVKLGWAYCLALKEDGTVWAWGANSHGQLGDGTFDDRSVPVQVKNLKDIVAVDTNYESSLAITKDGDVWEWGSSYDRYGSFQESEGNRIKHELPIRVNGISNVTKVACGDDHFLALKKDGTVWSWGGNKEGQLGDGTSSDNILTTPTKVEALSDVTEIAAGYLHSLALKSNGELYSWGNCNFNEDLDLNTKKSLMSPRKIASFESLNSSYEERDAVSDIKVYINGNEVDLSEPAVVRDGRILVPARPVFEALNAKVSWDGYKKTVIAEKNGTSVIIKIDSKKAAVNGEYRDMEVAAALINTQVYVPVRFAADAFKMETDWDKSTSTVWIDEKISTVSESAIDPYDNFEAVQSENNLENNNSSAVMAFQDGWLYFSNKKDTNKLYKIKTDGTSITKLNDDDSADVNILGEWIYYSNKSEGCKIYKIKKDGTGRSKVNDDMSCGLKLSGDWIYYTNFIAYDSFSLYKIRIDGSSRAKITDDLASCINIAGGFIYYINGSDSDRIYKISVDGTDRYKVNDDAAGSINISGGWIYYQDREENIPDPAFSNGTLDLMNDFNIYFKINRALDTLYGMNIYKINLVGGESTRLNADESHDINAAQDWILYSNGGEGYNIFRMKTDGSEKVKLNNDYSGDIYVSGNWIYYYSGARLYRVLNNGLHRQIVN